MNRFLGAIGKLTEKSSWLMYLLIAMSFILIYEIIARAIFNSPTIWAFETSAFIFGSHFILAAAYTLKAGGHVSVDIFTVRMSDKAKKYLTLMASLIILFVATIIIIRGIPFAVHATITKEGSNTYWNPPLYPIRWAMVIGYILLALEGLRQTIMNIKALIKRV